MLRTLALACLIVSLVPFGSTTAQDVPARSRVTYTFERGVSRADEYLIRESVRFAQDYLIATFGHDVGVPLRVTVTYSERPEDNVNWADGARRIFINSFTFRGYPPLIRTMFVVHEYFHIWQMVTADRVVDERNLAGPNWLIEGGADYVAMRALVWGGLITVQEAEEHAIQIANGAHNNGPPALPPLAELMIWSDMIGENIGCCSYGLSAVAVGHLVGQDNAAQYGAFYQALGSTDEAWESVFESTFGVSPDAFYTSFEAERSDLLRSTGQDVTQLLRTPAFNETPAPFALSVAPEQLDPGAQVIMYGWSENGSTCEMTVSNPDAPEPTTHTTFGDAYGLVVWFWTVPAALTAGSLTIAFECGGQPVLITVPVVDAE